LDKADAEFRETESYQRAKRVHDVRIARKALLALCLYV
jgi:hypothetical protein